MRLKSKYFILRRIKRWQNVRNANIIKFYTSVKNVGVGDFAFMTKIKQYVRKPTVTKLLHTITQIKNSLKKK